MIPVKDTVASKGIPFATISIIMANLALFYREVKSGQQFILQFSVSPYDIYTYLVNGTGSFFELHKAIFVSGFLHGGYIHIFFNMLFLYVFGPAVEKAFGVTRYVLFYTAALFVSFYTYCLVHPVSHIPIIGASGAIAAVMGAYLIFYPRARIVTIVPIIFFIEIIEVPAVFFMLGWFILQWANGCARIEGTTHIAWWSHIGGFTMGLVFSARFKWHTRHKLSHKR